jgi:hypothetical protein
MRSMHFVASPKMVVQRSRNVQADQANSDVRQL